MRINSVGPDGAISFRDAPFTFCGNRGASDDGEHVTAPYKGRRWIYWGPDQLRLLPELDPHFQRLYGLRNDSESINRGYKRTLFADRAAARG